MTRKYTNGAFVFTRAKGLTPKNPTDLIPVAERHGIDPAVIPSYSGDRAALGRAIARTDTRIAGDTYLLRPIKRNKTEVVYGIVREDRSGEDRLDHDHEATITWKAEPDPAIIEGDHTIANRIRMDYRDLRGKICTEDWTKTIGEELERLGAVAMRDDGRVHWLPQSSLDEVRKLQGFLSEVGVTMFLAEVGGENRGPVTQIVAESVEEQLHKLELEVATFDSKQKPSMFAKRLETYQTLRQKALLYQSALGIGAERTEEVLAELEKRVEAMLDVRTGTVVHRDGSVSKKGEKKPPAEPKTPKKATKGVTNVTSLTFAGAKFVPSESDGDELVFTSGDEAARSAVAGLESMGLTGRWQSAGNVEVSIQNSGPKGAETSIKVRTGGIGIVEAKKALGALGIGVG